MGRSHRPEPTPLSSWGGDSCGGDDCGGGAAMVVFSLGASVDAARGGRGALGVGAAAVLVPHGTPSSLPAPPPHSLHEPPPRHDHSHAQKDIEGTRNSLAGNEQLLLMLREKCSFTDKECEDSCAKKRKKFPLIAKSVVLEMSIKTLTDETQGFQAETSEIQVQ